MGTASEAWEAMQWAESAPDARESEQRVSALERLVPMARRFSNPDPLAASEAIYDDLARRPHSAPEAVGDVATRLADVAGRIPHAGRDAVALYGAIREGLHPVAALGETVDAPRMARYADLVDRSVDREGLEHLIEMVRVPVAGESLVEREAVLSTLWTIALDTHAGDCVEATVEGYQTLARTLYPGESLVETAELFEGLARAMGPEKARDVMSRLQSERLEGRHPGVKAPALVQRFLEAYATTGDVDRSMEIMHRPPSADPVVVDGQEEVVVGGIRIPKRR